MLTGMKFKSLMNTENQSKLGSGWAKKTADEEIMVCDWINLYGL